MNTETTQRSIEKHAVILAAASKLFLERGYGSTSMDAISHQAEVSKSTLYAHFRDKGHLFREVIEENRRNIEENIREILKGSRGDVREILFNIGYFFIKKITRHDYIDLLRIIISETKTFPELGEGVYKKVIMANVDSIARLLDQWNTSGEIQCSNTKAAAIKFLALVKAEIHIYYLLHENEAVPQEEIEKSVHEAVDIFLKYYGRPASPG